MSDELNELQRRLEQATAFACPSGFALDAETASLRESWLALGQLLEAAQPALAEPLKLREPARRRLRVGWTTAGAAALAASLLIGVTLAWEWVGGAWRDGPSLASGRIAADAGPPVAASKQAQLLPASDELDWDDPLDEQIILVAQEVVRVQQDWYHLDDAFGPVHRGVEEMEEDLEEKTL